MDRVDFDRKAKSPHSTASHGRFGIGWLRLAVILVAVYLITFPDVYAQQTGVTNRPYPSDQLFTVIGRLNASNGAPMEHSSVVVHQGYVVEVYSEENFSPRAGIAVYDLSDSTEPRLVARTEEDTGRLSEQHAIGFSSSYGRDLVALLAVDGVEIWDWTKVSEMHQVSRLELPGIAPGYGLGAWWLFWQAPYLYVSGASNGIYIVDVSDPANPFLADRNGQANPIPNSQTGGFRVGPIFAVGNLMVISSNDGRGYATLDIADPANPMLLDAFVERSPPSYSSMVNGNRLYAAGTDDDFHAIDISNPYEIRELDSVAMHGKGGYLTIQDNFAHVGASNHYVKIDISDDDEYEIVASASANAEDTDEDFAVAVGNLVVLSDDHYNGSFIFPHQAEPDNVGPVVTMVSPQDGIVQQLRSSRIGLTFSDRIDLASVNMDSLIVRPIDGEPLSGKYSSQTGIVNFTPDRPLEGDEMYEILVPAGGIRDVAGNAVSQPFRATFSTGHTGGSGFLCEVIPSAPVVVGETATFAVHILAGGGEIRYSWNFGDGTPGDEAGDGSTASHVYDAPGHFAVRVIADNGAGATACATQQTVHNHTVAGEAPSSSTIILDRTGTQIWNVNPDHDSVTAINAVTLEKMFEAEVGYTPRTLAQAPDGTIWVTNEGDGTITVLDSQNGNTIANIALPPASQPYGIIFSPDQRAAYVTLQATGTVLRLDPEGRNITGALPIGGWIRDLSTAYNARRLFVARHVSPANQGEIVEIDAEQFAVARTLALAMDPGPDTESSGRGLPNGLGTPVVSPDARQLWVPSKKDNVERGLQRDGEQLTFESTVRAIVSVIELETNEETLSLRHDFNDREGAVAVRFSPGGDYAFVALRGSNAVDVLDSYTGQLVTSIEDVGRAPIGMAFTSDGSKLFVHSWLDREVVAYDVQGIIVPGSLRAKLLRRISVVEKESLAPEVLEGKRNFYNAEDARMSRDGYLACSSCHLDGYDDGRIWDRTAEGEGMRNTIALVGHGGDTDGRMHWTANFDEVQDFEGDIRDLFGGLGFLSDSVYESDAYSKSLGTQKAGLSPELDALAAYVESLRESPASPYRNGDGSLTDEGRAGKALFNSMGCWTCHSGPGFTDSQLGVMHDVGTLNDASGMRMGRPLLGIDTPTLYGLWRSPPYLHDGSAATLQDVFIERNTGGRHGDLGLLLSTDTKAAEHLVAYLLQIDDSEHAPPAPMLPISVARPAMDATFRPGDVIKIGADTTPTLGPIARVEFYIDGEQIGIDDEPLYFTEWTSGRTGTFSIHARLVYETGVATLSPAIRIRVTE